MLVRYHGPGGRGRPCSWLDAHVELAGHAEEMVCSLTPTFITVTIIASQKEQG